MKRYNPSEIEPKWQAVWDEQKTYEVTTDLSRPKLYVSGMFPYPSGAGMHTGHAFSYSIVDAIARFYRQHGKNVLNPMGWDTFGLPAENYAIKTGTAPAEVTKANIANFKKQFKRMGVSIDWSREINTSDPEYYRWTQWVFAKFFERGLAYQKESMQWWCPVDKTVLANEQVEGGKCWRCGSQVEKKSMKQWFFKITDYADALLDEIEDLDWPQKIKTAQTNWIGKSQGAEIDFELRFADESVNDWKDEAGKPAHITVFTTRPDTIFGANFLVLAPEHPWVTAALEQHTALKNTEDVRDYVKKAVAKSEIERQMDSKDKTGILLEGVTAINPAAGSEVPVWVADYVLGGYGTGAIMAVPAHDERDFAFAEKFNMPITDVVAQDFGEELPESQEVEGVVVIAYDPKTKEFMGLTNERNDRGWLVSGGHEEGETFEQTAYRELREEAGFVDVEAMIPLGAPVYSYYYNSNKKVNRRSKGYNFLAIVDRATQGEQALEAHEKFVPYWTTGEELLKRTNPDGGAGHWYEGIVRAIEAAKAYEKNEPYRSEIYHGEGMLINSGEFDDMRTEEAREEIVAWLEQQGVGKSKVTYKMRDWLISRQRYWGAPIPVIHCDEHGAVAVPEDQLPVVLPDIEDYAPKGDGRSALATAEEWVNTTCPTCGRPAKRETDTMDGYACSSWYLLRYADPHNNEMAWDPEKANYWAPLDYYVGGDHAVAHLLYVRFWTHVFKDMGLTNFKEPVKKLVYHGYINAEDGTKMSKSKGNVIDPLDVIDQGYGADALRTYVLFMGPIELDAPWDPRGIAGIYRFLNRVWTLTQEFIESEKGFMGNDDVLRRAQHKTVRKVTDDYHRLSFNTAIAGLMEYVNELYKLKVDGFSEEAWREALGVLVRLLAPFAPHMSAELWQELGNETSIEKAGWPVWDDNLIIEETRTIVVQVNGKVRAKLTVTKDATEEEVKAQALEDQNVQKFVNTDPKNVIYVPGRILNIVL